MIISTCVCGTTSSSPPHRNFCTDGENPRLQGKKKNPRFSRLLPLFSPCAPPPLRNLAHPLLSILHRARCAPPFLPSAGGALVACAGGVRQGLGFVRLWLLKEGGWRRRREGCNNCGYWDIGRSSRRAPPAREASPISLLRNRLLALDRTEGRRRPRDIALLV
jgi:hypothetical protein